MQYPAIQMSLLTLFRRIPLSLSSSFARLRHLLANPRHNPRTRYREDHEVIKEFIPVANEAKRTLDENSDGTWIMTSMPGSQGYGWQEAVALMRFSEELAFVAPFFLPVWGRLNWAPKGLPGINRCFYYIRYLICNCLPSCIKFFHRTGSEKTLYNAVFASAKIIDKNRAAAISNTATKIPINNCRSPVINN
jgi:hypothetical protein